MTRRRIPGPRSGRHPAAWIVVAASVVLVLLSGCAEVGPPPGGPPDTVPPYVLAASPESLATGVDSSLAIALTFSEKVERRSVRNWLIVNPYRPIVWTDWSGPTFRFRLEGGLPDNTTMQVALGSGVTDRAGLPMHPPFSRIFTTGDSLAPGLIAGRLRASRLGAVGTTPGSDPRAPGPAPGRDPRAPAPAAGGGTAVAPPRPTRVPAQARFIWLFRAGPDTLPDPVIETPYWVAEADEAGNFRLDGLPLDVPFRLMALYDADRSRGAGGLRDYWSFDPDTLVLTAAAPRIEGRAVFLVDPASPGRLSGVVVPPPDSTMVDSIGTAVLAAVRPAGVDSLAMTWPPTSVARTGRVERNGAWMLSPLTPGRYRVAAWRDLNRNARLDTDEPLGPWREADVAADTDVTHLELARPPGP